MTSKAAENPAPPRVLGDEVVEAAAKEIMAALRSGFTAYVNDAAPEFDPAKAILPILHRLAESAAKAQRDAKCPHCGAAK